MSDGTFWRPYHRGTLMLTTFLADGEGLGGLVAIHDSRKFHGLGVVLGTNDVETVEPGDVVLYDEGRVEFLTDASGETVGVIGEGHLFDVLDLEVQRVNS